MTEELKKKMPNVGGADIKQQPKVEQQMQQNQTNTKPEPQTEKNDNKEQTITADIETAQEINLNLKKDGGEIEKLQQENKELERKLMYVVAEYENLKKRSQKEVDDAQKYAIKKLIEDAIKVYDVLMTAIDNTNPETTDKALYDGVKMTIGDFDKMFEKSGIVKINPAVGDRFDHNKHEAISRVPNSEVGMGNIVQVVRCGYELYGRLLRRMSEKTLRRMSEKTRVLTNKDFINIIKV